VSGKIRSIKKFNDLTEESNPRPPGLKHSDSINYATTLPVAVFHLWCSRWNMETPPTSETSAALLTCTRCSHPRAFINVLYICSRCHACNTLHRSHPLDFIVLLLTDEESLSLCVLISACETDFHMYTKRVVRL
jgi:hypothetical protein